MTPPKLTARRLLTGGALFVVFGAVVAAPAAAAPLAWGNTQAWVADGDTVEFTLADVTATASAGFDGETGTSLEHGELTAFGVPVGSLEDSETGYVVDDHVELLDGDGEVIEEIPVSVGFVGNETTSDDDDEGWEGRGVRSWLTVWVQVGTEGSESGGDGGNGLTVDFADAWAVGSTYASDTSRDSDDKPGPAPASNRLATTDSPLAALVTAALVAVGGGSAATLLARKRTTAMDDQIGD